SSAADFASRIRAAKGVEGAADTSALATRLDDVVSQDAASSSDTPAADSDTLSGLQWDMAQIRTPAAHAVTGGSPSIVVGDIDTGLDFTHPDLAANVDFADSVS